MYPFAWSLFESERRRSYKDTYSIQFYNAYRLFNDTYKAVYDTMKSSAVITATACTPAEGEIQQARERISWRLSEEGHFGHGGITCMISSL